jgi:hypothetical protein
MLIILDAERPSQGSSDYENSPQNRYLNCVYFVCYNVCMRCCHVVWWRNMYLCWTVLQSLPFILSISAGMMHTSSSTGALSSTISGSSSSNRYYLCFGLFFTLCRFELVIFLKPSFKCHSFWPSRIRFILSLFSGNNTSALAAAAAIQSQSNRFNCVYFNCDFLFVICNGTIIMKCRDVCDVFCLIKISSVNYLL